MRFMRMFNTIDGSVRSPLFAHAELCCRIIGIYPKHCCTDNSVHLKLSRFARSIMRTMHSHSLLAGAVHAAAALEINEVQIAGYQRNIGLRLYRRAGARALPTMLYFHGGG